MKVFGLLCARWFLGMILCLAFLSFLRLHVLVFEIDARKVDAHTVLSQVGLEHPHHGLADKGAQVVLDLLGVRVDPVEPIECFLGSDLSEAVLFLLGGVKDVAGIPGADDPVQPLHALDGRSGIEVAVFPEELYLLSLGLVFLDGVHVKGDGGFRRVKIVAVGESPEAHENLLSLKDHGLELVVGHLDDKVSPGKGKARRPERVEGRFAVDARHSLGLLPVPQVL
mmetsp:Transcript_473/g.993  ORF Transcript_473/g.993 Transcript_473/m.993 type:complete len:225 (-) Transcript_473:1479-2153(-)